MFCVKLDAFIRVTDEKLLQKPAIAPYFARIESMKSEEKKLRKFLPRVSARKPQSNQAKTEEEPEEAKSKERETEEQKIIHSEEDSSETEKPLITMRRKTIKKDTNMRRNFNNAKLAVAKLKGEKKVLKDKISQLERELSSLRGCSEKLENFVKYFGQFASAKRAQKIRNV